MRWWIVAMRGGSFALLGTADDAAARGARYPSRRPAWRPATAAAGDQLLVRVAARWATQVA